MAREGGREGGTDCTKASLHDPSSTHSFLRPLPSSLPPSLSLLLRPSTINYPCLRTGLTPLHKAIEVGREGGEGGEGGREGGAALIPLLKFLLEEGADREAGALLYDGERGWELARRFGRGEEVEGLLLAGGGGKG